MKPTKQLASAMLEFWRERLAGDRQFKLDELRDYLAPRCGYRPARPQRTMKVLQDRGKLHYRHLSARHGIYEALPPPDEYNHQYGAFSPEATPTALAETDDGGTHAQAQ